ncbi:retrotransposon protein, putative, ty1-copia subclass [Tanacetum coccineum]
MNTKGIERGFLSQKGSEVERGVKEKSKVVVSKDGVSPSVIVETVVKEKQSSLVDTSIPNVEKSGLGSYQPLPTPGSTPVGNTPRMSSVDIVVPVKSIRVISERFVYTGYGFFLGKRVAYLIVANYVRNTLGKYGLVKLMLNSSTRLFSFQFSSMDGGPWFIRNHPLILKKWNPDVNLLKEDVGNVLVWVKLHGFPVTAFIEDDLSAIATKADIELKDTIVVAMPKLIGEGFYTCTVRIEYEWKPPRCMCCKVFGHIQEECPKNLGLGVAKNLKKPSQAPKGVSVSSKVENDVDLGTNGGTSNLVSKEPNSSESSFWNVESSSTSTTLIVDKIEKFKKLIIDGKVTLVDDEGELVKKVDYPGNYDSEDEVASVDNDMTRSMASEKVGFGTNSLMEQWRDTYEKGDYDYDPYDDDMYEGQEIHDKIQAVCDNLDIKVRGRKKK